jgi:hypothetical protein
MIFTGVSREASTLVGPLLLRMTGVAGGSSFRPEMRLKTSVLTFHTCIDSRYHRVVAWILLIKLCEGSQPLVIGACES